VGVDRGLDGQSCHAATSLTAQSAGSAPRVPAFRRPGAAGGPPGHPAHHPGGWLRADQVPVRRHRVGHWADRTPAEIMPSRGSSCSPLGRAERENGHLTIRSVQPGARVTRAQSADRSRFTGPIAERTVASRRALACTSGRSITASTRLARLPGVTCPGAWQLEYGLGGQDQQVEDPHLGEPVTAPGELLPDRAPPPGYGPGRVRDGSGGAEAGAGMRRTWTQTASVAATGRRTGRTWPRVTATA